MTLPRLFLPAAAHLVAGTDLSGCFATELPETYTRVLWDGGLTRDFPRPLWDWSHDDEPATGLFDERGYVVKADDAFLNQLPCVPLDGYLHTVDGVPHLGVFGLPSMAEFYKVGDVLGGDRIFKIEADGVFDLMTNTPVASSWRQADQGWHFTHEMFHAMASLSAPAEPCLFRQIQSEFDLDHNKKYLIRHPGSTWACGFMSSWFELNTCEVCVADVYAIINGKLHTTKGTLPLECVNFEVEVGDTVVVYINDYGFITGADCFEDQE
jgi:hypothetical protein